ncbi:rieske [2Fe-2S] domain protein [Collimonas pratensis]|uniref:Rieske [2Fe-2S] domain protein n=1 Tax=Collimonas pratensis TaxID=279113 RepID=A0A127Q4H9_9BURK|nr:rieske [2Fe-2S] domain protein [Collimonas pratensis]
MKILGLGIVLFRLRSGMAVALVDQCVHRGTRLSVGKIADDCLVCPYHGWRYDAQGQVVHIPTIDGCQPGAASSGHQFRQRQLQLRQQDGLIWVYRGNGVASRPPFRMPFYAEKPWQSYFMVNTFDGDISMLAQNFMDVPHTVFVHDGIFRSSRGSAMEAIVALKAESVEVTYHDSQDKIGMLDWLTNPKRESLVHTDCFFAPNVTRCDYSWGDLSSFLIVSQITPIDARRSRVYTYIAYRFPLPGWVLWALKPLLHLYTHIVIQQDVRIMRAHQQGLDNAAGFEPHNVRADIVHVGIERLLAAVRRGETVPEARQGVKPMRFEL